MAQHWDREVDTLVVGSGAGGLLAALVATHGGADTLIVEKTAKWGGTSATSGGGIWMRLYLEKNTTATNTRYRLVPQFVMAD